MKGKPEKKKTESVKKPIDNQRKDVAVYNEAKHVTVETLSKLTGLTTRRLQQIRQDGGLVTEETTRGQRYVLLASLVSFIKYLLKNQDTADITQETKKADLRLKKAKAKVVENELRIVEGESHRADHVRQMFSFMITETKSSLKGLPGRCAVACSGATPTEVSEILKKEIHAVFSRMCQLDYDPQKFAELVKEEGGTSTFGLEGEKDEQ